MHVLQTMQTPKTIDSYVEQAIHFVPVQDIYAAYAEGAKVYIQTNEDEFEVDELFAHDFRRVNKPMLLYLQKFSSFRISSSTVLCILWYGQSCLALPRRYYVCIKG